MIAKYISELLYDHNCVIVPELGAFIANESPATVDYVNHCLTPPSKEVAFNGQLITDDGLLIGYLAKRQGISMTEAAKMVHDFAMQSLAVIEASGILRLDGMGVLSRVTDKDYVFQLDENLNLFGDAFGLTTLKVQPIYRKDTYQQIANQIATEQKAKNTVMTVQEEQADQPHHVNRHNYKWFRAAAYSMMIATALVLIGWGTNISDSKLASWIPIFYSSPNEFIANQLNNEMEMREIPTVEPFDALEVSVPIFELEDVDYIEPLDEELLQPVDLKSYYIIGASLSNANEAKNYVKRFKDQGFAEAVALPVNSNGHIRVAYEVVMGKDAAIKRMEVIRRDFNKDAWMLRKK